MEWEEPRPVVNGESLGETQSPDRANAFRSAQEDRETGTPIRGKPINQKILIPLELAAKGGMTRIWIDQEVPCSCCEGSGAKPGTRIRRCYRCRGMGLITLVQDSVSTTQVCPLCSGRGAIFRIPCPECKGSGFILRKWMVSVPVQPGVRSGERIHLKGKGHPGRFGGPSGDLYLSVRIEPHPEFRRIGYHIETTAKIDIVTATLGGRVIVPTLNGNAYVVIPPGSRSGTRLRLKGKGILRPNGECGDQYIVLVIVPPRKVNEEQKKLLWRFRRIGKLIQT